MYNNNNMGKSFEDQVAGAEVSRKLPYFQPGFDGDVEIFEVQKIDQTEKGPLWVVAVIVKTSNHPAHPVGQRASWIQKLALHAAPGAVLEFLVAGYEGDPRNDAHVAATRPHVGTIINQVKTNPTSNPLIGKVVHLITLQTRKKDGGPFTKHMWGPATGTAGAQIMVPELPVAPVWTPQMNATPPAAPSGNGTTTAFVPPWQK